MTAGSSRKPPGDVDICIEHLKRLKRKLLVTDADLGPHSAESETARAVLREFAHKFQLSTKDAAKSLRDEISENASENAGEE